MSCFPRSAGERPAASSLAGRFDDTAVDQEVFLVKADQPVPVPSWHSSTTEEAAQALANQANTGTFLAGLGLTVVPAGPNRLAIQAEHEPARVLPTPVPPRATRPDRARETRRLRPDVCVLWAGTLDHRVAAGAEGRHRHGAFRRRARFRPRHLLQFQCAGGHR